MEKENLKYFKGIKLHKITIVKDNKQQNISKRKNVLTNK